MVNAVFLDSKFLGYVKNPETFAQQIREARRNGLLPNNINVYFSKEDKNIYIFNSKGRVQRPLIIVKNGKPLLTEQHIRSIQKKEMTWQDLINKGIIEYLDASEEENALVAFKPEELTEEHTHLEIMPLAIVGACTSLAPFGEFTQSPRLLIGSKNQKQSVGLYAANYLMRMDMDVHLLNYPQHPIVKTFGYDIFDLQKHPSGQNIIVAVMDYEGYNIEDSVILNKASIERGLARSTYFRVVSAEELRYSGGLSDEITIPDKDVRGYKSEKDYRFLDDDGIAHLESRVKEGDVVIGKVSPPRFYSSLQQDYSLSLNLKRESSIALMHGEKAVVDSVYITESIEGNKLVQVKLRDQRIPELGDKFISRHGQKGVVGLILPQSDMPFTANGIVPDLIFSSHSIPSRMTVSHLMELLAGKVGSLAARNVDATLFDSESEFDLRKELLDIGFREDGTEVMYDGISGKRMKVRIFVGSMYYLRLKHLVANKIQARARGPIQLLTRQPTEGRAKEGGLRLEEMAKDAFVAHGASLLLKERFDSDKTVIPVCEKCGMIAIYDHIKNKTYCPVCKDNTDINFIEVSYAFKLFLDELKSMGIYPKLKLTTKY